MSACCLIMQANRHKLLSIFESMKVIAEDQEAEKQATEERACRTIQVCASTGVLACV